jgi:hypothetical protein
MGIDTYTDATLSLLARLLATDLETVSRGFEVLSGPAYDSWTVPKGNGRVRKIDAPVPELKRLQSLLLNRLLNFAPISPFAHGFVRGRSIVTNASVHRETARAMVSLDLKDAYPSVSRDRVLKALEWGVGSFLKHSSPMTTRAEREAVYEAVGDACTHRDALPQGAPTSGQLLNMVCCSLDRHCARLVRRFRPEVPGLRYTRYADDLTFTAAEELSHEFLERAIGCVLRAGFEVNRRKVKRYTVANSDLVICGVRLHEGQLTLPRRVLRKYRALLFQALAREPEDMSDGARQHVHGAIGFLTMATTVCPPQLEGLLQAVLQQHRAWLRPGTKPAYFPFYRSFSQK